MLRKLLPGPKGEEFEMFIRNRNSTYVFNWQESYILVD